MEPNTTNTNRVVKRTQTEAETLIGTSRLTKILADGGIGITGASVSLVTMPPGGETEKHQKTVTEVYYVIEGEMTIRTDHGDVTFETGDAGASLPGTLHSHKNSGRSWNQFLVIITPSGREQEFRRRKVLEGITVDDIE
jgi:quercetin dioxygenase-like cupin family protein